MADGTIKTNSSSNLYWNDDTSKTDLTVTVRPGATADIQNSSGGDLTVSGSASGTLRDGSNDNYGVGDYTYTAANNSKVTLTVTTGGDDDVLV